MSQDRRVKGLHVLIDLYGCDPHQINSSDFWQQTIKKAIQNANMEELHAYYHEFKPQGITGFALLSTSHISVHSWPEYNYAACDVFSCSDDANTRKAAESIIKSIETTRRIVQKVKRGYVVTAFLESPIYRTGKIGRIQITKKFAEINSVFQKILLLELKKFGKSLVIDGLVQTSEYDHKKYDNALLTPLKSQDKHLLILGGGDGYVAETALKQNPNLKITIIDLDPEVVYVSKKYLNQKIFDHPNVHLKIGDALTFLRNYKENIENPVDGVISDLTDNPVGTRGIKAKTRKFYNEVFTLSKKILKPGGWISAQAGASEVTPKYIDMTEILQSLLIEKFGNCKRKDVLIPSYGEKNAFVWSIK